MSASTRACPTCRGETAPHTIPDTTGTDASVAITVHELPVLRCAAGHVHFVDVEFPLRLLRRLTAAEEGALPVARRKGFIFRRSYCARCGEALPDAAGPRRSFDLDAALDGADALRLALELPVYRCTGCGAEQLRVLDDARDHTPAALAKAFEAAGVEREA